MAHPSPNPARLEAYDLDGTLTTRDSLWAFLVWRWGAARMAGVAARLAPALASYALDRDRGRLKTAVLRATLAGTAEVDVRAGAAAFWDERGDGMLRPGAAAHLRADPPAGVTRVLVTACPQIIAEPVAARFGLRLIGTQLAMADGRLTGALEGANCRGEEKVRRLEETFGADLKLVAAFGDSDGDAAMLARADVAHWRPFRG